MLFVVDHSPHVITDYCADTNTVKTTCAECGQSRTFDFNKYEINNLFSGEKEATHSWSIGGLQIFGMSPYITGS